VVSAAGLRRIVGLKSARFGTSGWFRYCFRGWLVPAVVKTAFVGDACAMILSYNFFHVYERKPFKTRKLKL